MTIPTIFIPICDQNLWILKIYSYLFKKFWGVEQPVVVLGFGKPDFELPKNFTFVSLAEKQEGGASKWSRYLYNYFSSIEDEYVIFTLEDFFPIQKPNIEVLNFLYSFTKKHDIGRCDITWDSYVNIFDKNNIATRSKSYKAVAKNDDFLILDIPKNAPYRISTQPSIWQRQYLLNFLNNDWSPWDFEIRGTHESSKSDKKIIAIADSTFVNYPTKWIHKGAVSRYHEGKINVLGLDIETIKELIDLDLVQRENLQWGQWNGNVPTFDELGGFDFHPVKMPAHEASPTNWKEYQNIYNPDKEIVNLFDNNFSHTKDLWGYVSSNGNNNWGRPKNIEYILNNREFEGITIFTDHFLGDRNFIDSIKSKKKVAWICEPPAIHPWAYDLISKTHDLFDLIVSYDSSLTKKYNNCIHSMVMETRLKPEECKIHEKSNLVSLIASNKKMSDGHRFRFDISNKFANKYNIDLWGSAFKSFESKLQPLKDYCFSITVHNCKIDDFYTEALVDCFLAGTVPIFWGCPNIGDYFDSRGILSFDTLDDLEKILNDVSFELYDSMKPYITNNFEIAKKHQVIKDDQLIDVIKRRLDEN